MSDFHVLQELFVREIMMMMMMKLQMKWFFTVKNYLIKVQTNFINSF